MTGIGIFFVVAILGVILSLINQNTRSNGHRSANHSNFNQGIHPHTHNHHQIGIQQSDISTDASYVESYNTSDTSSDYTNESASSADSGGSESYSSSSGFESSGGFDSGSGSSGSGDGGTNNNN